VRAGLGFRVSAGVLAEVGDGAGGGAGNGVNAEVEARVGVGAGVMSAEHT
jgi:hypothetical protein